MSADLAVIVPSRGRPKNIADLLLSWVDNTSDKAALVVAVDDDDPELDGYRDLGLMDRGPNFALVVQHKPGNMVVALNRTARTVAPRHFAVGFMGDDHRPRTPGWDLQVVEALKDLGTGVASGADGFRADHLPTWCAMTSNIIRALGYMAPPGLKHMYVDNAWESLGTALGAYRYLPDVLVEHMHPFAGKAPSDEGYARVNSAGVYARDEAAYVHWSLHELRPAVEAIKAAAVAR